MKSRREFMFKEYGDHRDLHVLTHSFPTRRSSDLRDRRVPALQDRHHRRRRAHLSEGGMMMADFTNEQFRLDGKVAVVPGAGGRGNSIGRAYAIGLANAGASVVVADQNRDGAERVAGEREEAGGTAIEVQGDIADEASVSAMMETAEADRK